MDNCIFCKIINNDISAEKIYEDDEFLAFLDINPVSVGHSLLIPKSHVEWMHEAEDEVIKKIFTLTKKMMKHFMEKLKCDYVQVAIVGKDVPHFHVHLIPRMLEEEVRHKDTLKLSPLELTEIAKKIQM